MSTTNLFMPIVLSAWHAIIMAALFLWKYLVIWASLFVAPYHNLETLWIIIPIYISWVLAEFFQEKRSTSFGNAISNGGVMLWVGIDWLRYLSRMLAEGTIKFGWQTIFKYTVAVIVLGYGLTIIIHGIKGKRYIRFFGRIRGVTYVMLMFTPIVYGIVKMDWHFFIAILLYFPLYYGFIELLDLWIPDPKILEEDEGGARKAETKAGPFSGASGSFSPSTPTFDSPGKPLPDFSSGFGPQPQKKPSSPTGSRPPTNRNPRV